MMGLENRTQNFCLKVALYSLVVEARRIDASIPYTVGPYRPTFQEIKTHSGFNTTFNGETASSAAE
jgi:hypothetical protein